MGSCKDQAKSPAIPSYEPWYIISMYTYIHTYIYISREREVFGTPLSGFGVDIGQVWS